MSTDPTTPHPAEVCLKRTLAQVEDYARREPAKAVAAALGTGLLLQLLPARALSRPLAAAFTALLPPTLLGLGVLKALELLHPKAAEVSAPEPREPSV